MLTLSIALSLAFLGTNMARGSTNPNNGLVKVSMTDSEKADFEKQVNADLKDWEGKVNQLRADIKKTHIYEKHHRHLRRAARHLESDIRDVKNQLSKFKKAPEKELKHYEDHIKAELDDMEVTYNKVLSE